MCLDCIIGFAMITREIKELLKDTYPAYLLIAVIFGLGLAILLFVPTAYQNPNLELSNSNLVGAVTGIFLNTNFGMFFDELCGFVLASVFLMLSCFGLDSNKRRYMIRFFVSASLLIGIVATLIWTTLPHSSTYSYGSSGVGFAEFGIVAGFAVIMVTSSSKLSSEMKKLNLLINTGITIFMLYYILFSPKSFFNISAGVNSLVHEISFLIAFVVGLIYLHRVLRHMPKN